MVKNALLRGKWVLVGSGTKRRIVKDGAVYVDGDTIKDIAAYETLKERYKPEFEYGSENHVVMPGLINSHHHGKGLSHLQRGVKDGPLELWIHNFFTQVTYGINTYYDVLLSAINQIENGITCTMHHFYGPVDLFDFKNYVQDITQGIRGNIDAGIRVAFAPHVYDQNRYTYVDSKFVAKVPKQLKEALKVKTWSKEEMASRSELYFKAFQQLYDKFNRHDGPVHVFLGPANAHWCSDELWVAVKKRARKLKTGIHTHSVETKYQMLYGPKFYKDTAPRHLAKLGVLGPEVSLAHSVWMRKEDLRVLAKTQATCVHNASSNLRLSSGICPVLEMRRAGVSVAMGIDGTGINDEEDMFQEMRLVSLLHRVPGLDSYGLPSEDILDMATIGGAKVTGWAKEIGALEVGRKADILLVDTRRIFSPSLSPRISIIDALVLRGKGLDVDTVMINGEVVMQNRKYLKRDKERVYQEVRKWPEAPAAVEKRISAFRRAVQAAYRGWNGRKFAYRYNKFA